jgi:hypothetical protein
MRPSLRIVFNGLNARDRDIGAASGISLRFSVNDPGTDQSLGDATVLFWKMVLSRSDIVITGARSRIKYSFQRITRRPLLTRWTILGAPFVLN